MSIKASRIYGIGLALLAVSAFAACSSDDTTTPNNNNHAGTTSTAGTGAGGTPAVGGTTGTAGSGTAGSGTAGSGTAGSGTAGTGSGGMAGAGGGGSNACKGTMPSSSLITSFEDATADAMNAGQVKYTLGIPGGTFTYPKANFTVDASAKNLHVTGMVKDYSGFGVYFNDCTNAAMAGATGVSFNIKGNVGTTAMLSFRINTNADTPAANGKGLCPAGAMYDACHANTFTIPVAAGGGDVSVTWDKLMGGVPVATVDGKDIVGLEWAFDWAGTGATEYAVDVTVDDIKFTGTIMGGGGMGGMGGTGGSGGGGAGGGGAGGNGGTGGTQ